MSALNILIADARYLLETLGADGGWFSPSIYNTAQVLRYLNLNPGQTIEWLEEQQYADGGWGEPSTILHRHIDTLAAVLALQTLGKRERTRHVVAQGVAFLRREQMQWVQAEAVLPAGAELLMPEMAAEARALGLRVPPYEELQPLARQKRKAIQARLGQAGTPLAHIWEGWGAEIEPDLIDAAGTLGHSPAATARWIALTGDRPGFAGQRRQLYASLMAAGRSCRAPNVFPQAWPNDMFEISFGLYAFLLADLHTYAPLPLAEPIGRLQAALSPAGLGFSQHFQPDGDDTAVAMAVLARTGHPADSAVLMTFYHQGCFCAWRGELQSASSVSAHAIHALKIMGAPEERYKAAAGWLKQQARHHLWPGDKWHASPWYATSQALIALEDELPLVATVVEHILDHQNQDGGWGSRINGQRMSTMEETAYVVLALQRQRARAVLSEAGLGALRRAERWMIGEYRPFTKHEPKLWLAKDPYRPHRIVHAFVVAALLRSIIEGAE